MRLRITRQEYAQLAKGEQVQCICSFDQIHTWQLTLKTWLLEVPGYDLGKKEWLFQIPSSQLTLTHAPTPWEAEWQLDSGFRIHVEVDFADFKAKHP